MFVSPLTMNDVTDADCSRSSSRNLDDNFSAFFAKMYSGGREYKRLILEPIVICFK